jgi:hypothetical protein
MKRGWILMCIFLCSCEGLFDGDRVPANVYKRKTIQEIKSGPAYLGVWPDKDANGSLRHRFYLELVLGSATEKLMLADDILICDLLSNLVVNPSWTDSPCVLGYNDNFLAFGNLGDIYRLHVLVDGEIKERHPEDPVGLKAFSLRSIKKGDFCTIQWQQTTSSPSLASTNWKWIGFAANGRIYSKPACEDQEIRLTFESESLLPSQFEFIPDPAAKRIRMTSQVWQSNGLWADVYIPIDNSQLRIDSALFHPPKSPGPVIPINSFEGVTWEMKHKFDSLNLLLKPNDTITYRIDLGTLMLTNPRRGLSALFVAQ